MSARIEIPLSKKKNLLMVSGTIIFTVLGCMFIVDPNRFASFRHTNEYLIQTVGVIGVAFFGLAAIYGIIKLFDKKAGLVIDENGITDNTNATSVGLILWKDIVKIERVNVRSQRFLIVHTAKPEKYIQKAKGRMQKVGLRANYKFYGTPIFIIAHSLRISFDDLEMMLQREFKKYRKGEL